MLKRILVLGILAVMLLSGCTEKPTDTIAEEPQKTEETEALQEEEIAETEETAVEQPEVTAPVIINIDEKKKTYYFEDSEQEYLYLQYCDVSVDAGMNENLKKNIENWSMERSEKLRSEADFYETLALEKRDNSLGNFEGFGLYQNVASSRIDGKVVSLMEDNYWYLGDENSSSYRAGFNFDAKTGKRLELRDIFSDYESFKADAALSITKQLEETYGDALQNDHAVIAEKMWLYDMKDRWYFNSCGIVLVVEESLVEDYSVGASEISLPFTEIGRYIKEAYLPDEQDGIVQLRQNQEVLLSVPGEEEAVSLMLCSELKDDYMMYNSLKFGNHEMQLPDYVAVQNAYLVRKSGEIYCIVGVDEASDDYVTYIFRLTDGRVEKVDEIYAGIDEKNINIDEIRMETAIYLLGTYGGTKTYQIDENHELVTSDTEYQLLKNEFALTTKVDLPVIVEGKESILPAGSHIVLKATDNDTYVKFTIQETGQNGELSVERKEDDYYDISINGVNENDCFEVLPYAG